MQGLFLVATAKALNDKALYKHCLYPQYRNTLMEMVSMGCKDNSLKEAVVFGFIGKFITRLFIEALTPEQIIALDQGTLEHIYLEITVSDVVYDNSRDAHGFIVGEGAIQVPMYGVSCTFGLQENYNPFTGQYEEC